MVFAGSISKLCHRLCGCIHFGIVCLEITNDAKGLAITHPLVVAWPLIILCFQKLFRVEHLPTDIIILSLSISFQITRMSNCMLKVLLALHLRSCHTDSWNYYIWFSLLCPGELFMIWRFAQRFNLHCCINWHKSISATYKFLLNF